MPYPRTFGGQQQEIIDALEKPIRELEPRATLEIDCGTEASAVQLRALILAWLSPTHSGLKSQYTTRLNGPIVEVKRFGTALTVIEKVEEAISPKIQELFFTLELYAAQDLDELASLLEAHAELSSQDKLGLASFWEATQQRSKPKTT